MKTLFLLMITLCPLLSFSESVKRDTIVLINGQIDYGTISRINYNRRSVSIVRDDAKDRSYLFREISSIHTKEGRSYLTGIYKTETQLLCPILEGNIDLLFNEGDSRFYVCQDNALLLISKENLELALIAIFGRNKMEAFSRSNVMSPSYGQKYLGLVVCFMNEKDGSTCKRKQQLGRFAKGSLYVGVGAAVQFSKSWIEYGYRIRNDRVWLKSDRIGANSIPVGIELAVDVGRSLQIDFNFNYGSTELPDFYYGDGTLDIIGLRPGDEDKFEKSPVAQDFKFRAINADLSVRYFLTKDGKKKVRPYIAVGPTLSVLTNYSYTCGVRYHDGNRILVYEAKYPSASKGMAVGYKVGTGLFWKLREKIVLNVYASYQAARYPRLRLEPEPSLVMNTTPYLTYQFNAVGTFAISRYDQMLRAASAGASLLFKI